MSAIARLVTLAAALAALLLCPASALAARARVESGTLFYEAGPGDGGNHVTIAREGGNFRITETGANLNPNAGCQRVAGRDDQILCTAGGVSLVKVDVRNVVPDGDFVDTTTVVTPVAAVTGEGNDTVTVRSGANVDAGSGDDSITGDGALSGGPGRDHITGGSLDDALNGGGGVDLLEGDSGDDELIGGDGDDSLFGGIGSDTFPADPGGDHIDGGDPDEPASRLDTVDYSSRTDPVAVTTDAGTGNDGNAKDGSSGNRDDIRHVRVVIGTPAADSMTGGTGPVRLRGLGGPDTLTGGQSDDVLEGGAGADALSGGVGGAGDLVSYADHTGPVFVDLGVGGADGGNDVDGPLGARDLVSSDVEGAIGGNAGDLIVGNGGRVFGQGGDDRLIGTNGDDPLEGGPGDDRLEGLGGNDDIRGGDGDDTLIGGFGRDLIHGNGDDDTVSYQERSAPVTVKLDDDVNDDGNADDESSPGSGRDVLVAVEAVRGGSGADTLTAAASGSGLLGGPGDDTLIGLAGADLFEGDEGADTVAATGGGFDTFSYADHQTPVVASLDGVANDGTDANGDGIADEGDSIGGNGIDELIGGSKDDRLTGNALANRIVGGPGRDTITAGDGADDVQTVDGVKDTVDCGPGTDGGFADFGVIVDLRDVLTNCENFGAAALDSHPTVRIARGALRAGRGGTVAVRLSCPKKLRRGCSGRLTLTTSAAPPVVLGSERYRLRRGQAKRVRVRMTSRARRLLAARRRLTVRATARERDARDRPKTTVATLALRR